MRYCVKYQKNNTAFMDKADEILINYNKNDTTLIDFLQKFILKRIIISILDTEDFKTTQEIRKFIAIKADIPEVQFTLRLPAYDEPLVKELRENQIPFFISIFANNWDTFNGLLEEGVSDIYVVEDLGFELDLCAEKAHNKGVYIRVFPNVAQSSWDKTEDIKKFFIRPEDVDLYESYVDTFEFLEDPSKEEILYKIYKEDKKWYGELKEIIKSFDINVDSRYIIPKFAEVRIKCGKKCMKKNNCHICDRIVEFQETLKERGITVSLKK